MSSEFRKDLLSDKWVIILNSDNDFIPDKDSKFDYKSLPEYDNYCPFCPGNESKTRFSIFEIKKGDKWNVRVIPNNKPYLKVETNLKRYTKDIFAFINGTGANEVIIETPIHNIDFDEMKEEDIASVLKTYKERFLDLRKDERLEHIIIIKSRGAKAGSYIPHLHSQLVAFPVVPPVISEEISEAENYYKIKNNCVYCDMIKTEIKLDERVVLLNEHFICISPFSSRVSFELLILPREHRSHFYDINDREVLNLALILKESIHKLNRALGFSAYNMILHSSPLKLNRIEHYHWHIEILPKLKNFSGFEQATGLFINSTTPEEATKYLKSLK